MKKLLTALIVGASILLSTQPARAMDELTVAYFLTRRNWAPRSNGLLSTPVLRCQLQWLQAMYTFQ